MRDTYRNQNQRNVNQINTIVNKLQNSVKSVDGFKVMTMVLKFTRLSNSTWYKGEKNYVFKLAFFKKKVTERLKKGFFIILQICFSNNRLTINGFI